MLSGRFNESDFLFLGCEISFGFVQMHILTKNQGFLIICRHYILKLRYEKSF